MFGIVKFAVTVMGRVGESVDDGGNACHRYFGCEHCGGEKGRMTLPYVNQFPLVVCYKKQPGRLSIT